tara:strand:- start:5789 stop:6166 length:378 start_codon:yes stop_codon:yes gene_type:complete
MNINNLVLIFMISLGAILGVNTRYLIIKKFIYFNLRKDIKILIINLISAFLLGISFPIIFQDYYLNSNLYSFLFAFFTSFSTFSSFIYNIFSLIKKRKFKRLIFILIFSIPMGIIIFYLGYLINS